MNEYDRDYIDRVKADLAQLDRSDRACRMAFIAVCLAFFWLVAFLAVRGFMV